MLQFTLPRALQALVPGSLLALLYIASIAKADTLDYTLTTPNETATWSINTTATPNVVSLNQGFIYNNIPVTVNGATHNEQVAFGNASGPADTLVIASDVAFETSGEVDGGNVFLLFGSTTLYTGSEANPTFRTGTFNIVNVFEGSSIVHPDTLVVTDVSAAATPEPSSLALLGTGLLGAAATLRRRLL